MRNKLRDLYQKHGDILRYLIVGGVTTLIDLVSFALFSDWLHLGYQPAKALAWVLAVIFAFAGNKWIVFKTEGRDSRTVFREAAGFFAMRLLTLLISMGILYVAIDLLGFSKNLSNLLCNIIVIILNYVLSKLVVFRAVKK